MSVRSNVEIQIIPPLKQFMYDDIIACEDVLAYVNIVNNQILYYSFALKSCFEDLIE